MIRPSFIRLARVTPRAQAGANTNSATNGLSSSARTMLTGSASDSAAGVQAALRLNVGGVGVLQVRDKPSDPVKVVTDRSQREVAAAAQQPSDVPAFVAVVYHERGRWPVADAAATALRGLHATVVINAQSVALPQVIRPNLLAVPALVRVRAQTLGLLLRSAWVALSAPTVTVAAGNAKEFKGQRGLACAACFNRGSHDANPISLIGQRPARVASTARASLF